ncbi:MAG: hypothetical protein M1366_06255 [Patescibacteria group bacterium]|nr:hypothetical protein [Patescibacteria group bacterium]
MQKEALIFNGYSGDGNGREKAMQVQSELGDLDIINFFDTPDRPELLGGYTRHYVLAGDATFSSVYRMLTSGNIHFPQPFLLVPFPGGGEQVISQVYGWKKRISEDEITDLLEKISEVREGKIKAVSPLTASGKRVGDNTGDILYKKSVYPVLPAEFPFLWILDSGFSPDVLKTVDLLGKHGLGNRGRRLLGMTIGALNNLRKGEMVKYEKNGEVNSAMGMGLVLPSVPLYSAHGRIDRQIDLANVDLVMMRIMPEKLIGERTRLGAFATFLNDMAAFELGKPAKGGALIFEPIPKDAKVTFSPPGGLVDLDSLVTYSPQESVIYDGTDRYGDRNGSVLIARRI